MLLPTLVVGRIAYSWRNIQLDDAMIYLRYTRNFREGKGLVFNPGERFNGLTSPLFAYMMAAGSFVVTYWQLLMIALATVLFLAAVIVFGLTFGSNRWESAFISVALASCTYFYATFGMETPMFLLMIALTLYASRMRSDYVLVAAALLVGTRPEGVFLAVPAVFEFLRHHRRLPRRTPVVLALLIGATPLVVNLVYYGELLPATSGAKLGQGDSGYWGSDNAFLKVDYLRAVFFSGSKAAVFLLVVLALAGVIAFGRDHVVRIACVFAASLGYFYWAFNLPNYHWYYAPFIALAVVFASNAVWRLGTPAFAAVRKRNWRMVALVPLVAISVFVCDRYLTLDAMGHHPAYEATGVWIRENTTPEMTVASVEIGNLAWYSERPYVDVLGLTNSKNAEFIADRDLYGWLSVYQPDVVVRNDPPSFWDVGIVVLEEAGAYAADPEFPYPGLSVVRKTGDLTDAEIVALINEVRGERGLMP